jgi:hypothetical protein
MTRPCFVLVSFFEVPLDQMQNSFSVVGHVLEATAIQAKGVDDFASFFEEELFPRSYGIGAWLHTDQVRVFGGEEALQETESSRGVTRTLFVSKFVLIKGITIAESINIKATKFRHSTDDHRPRQVTAIVYHVGLLRGSVHVKGSFRVELISEGSTAYDHMLRSQYLSVD